MADVPTTQEQIVREFLSHVHGKGLHPNDAAIEMGIPVEQFIALRDENPAVDAAWWGSEWKVQKLRKPRSVLEVKHKLAMRIWSKLGPKVMNMVERISDDEHGDDIVRDLLKNGIISDTLPRESFGQQELTVKEEDPFEKMTEAELFALYEKKIGSIAELKEQAEKAELVRKAIDNTKAVDAEFERRDSGEAAAR